ncbi:DUF3365 domain-containing protein [Accumulibacter sp.]|jgi:hypothetical protein|uniref:Tll0287-like domain-containing protein n=1 Tax=Accumulibacter sp. TaxID=2053492 RepID=UPI001AC754D1|nr:DUF3365 domain-containing protein [Accumulibacter sp.]MBN8455453.1 DUF3365 domain-containing protein [Accumulibacter sp.]MBO3707846.1 DUF3365 domain-containing protein [Candidatus Accumulibacter conexus]
MKATVSIALLVCTLPVCAQDLAALTTETRATVLPVIPKVITTMQETVATEGVAGAIGVCKDLAPQLIVKKREETGWDIRRVSLKTRNAERGTPDAWEAAQLADFDRRAAGGEKPETIEKSEIVSVNGRPVLRYMKALPVSEVCLGCHGPVDGLDADLRRKLADHYPSDRATGYAKGQIRGALTVKRPL